jgi:hypothetical protein
MTKGEPAYQNADYKAADYHYGHPNRHIYRLYLFGVLLFMRNLSFTHF